MFRKFVNPLWLWPIALICSAISFPAMPFRGHAWPTMPTPESVAWQDGRTFFHNMKNVTSEMYAADAMWWSKFSCFVVLILSLIIAI